VTRSALRGILLALLVALVAGFVAGTLIRRRFERPVRYLGALDAAAGSPLEVAPGSPLDVAAAGAVILEPGEHEEQVG
jgi:hypothetical protein